MMGGTTTETSTYTTADVENVVRRVKADLTMIADSTRAWTAAQAADFAYDIELLAKKGYLAWVDVTLFSGDTEIKAVRYDVDADAGSLSTSRPGGVLWPNVSSPSLRILVSYTDDYDDEARRSMSGKLRIVWTTSYDDSSHSLLNGAGGRNYVSNSYGVRRRDWSE
jgi:hypothetical protein